MINPFAFVSRVFGPVIRALSPVMFAIQSVVALVALMLYPPLMGIIVFAFIMAFKGGPGQFLIWLSFFFGLTIALIVCSQWKTKWLARAAAIVIIILQLIELGVIVGMALVAERQVWIEIWTFVLCAAILFTQINLWWLLRHYTEVWAGVKAFFTWLFRNRAAAVPATPAAGTVAGLPAP